MITKIVGEGQSEGIDPFLIVGKKLMGNMPWKSKEFAEPSKEKYWAREGGYPIRWASFEVSCAEEIEGNVKVHILKSLR
jgi:hypothetical protein